MLRFPAKIIRYFFNVVVKLFRSAEEDFGNYSCVASNLMGTSRYCTDARDDDEVTFEIFLRIVL